MLDRSSSDHIVKVLRLEKGAQIVLFDCQGGEYRGKIMAVSHGLATINIKTHHPVDPESPLKLTLVQALLRNERMDLVIQKAVELGVNRIVPLMTERGVVRLTQLRKKSGATLIGPEGGWDTAEQQLPESCGYLPIGFGPRILRSETAGMAMVTAAQLLWGDVSN
ncbi:MAG: hypothetical protein BMS9Abin15_0404 [Gammaproteobacteria bacterium]|nr:MAG: hypothetical protein BMS9Abin15_0404 [Gammaproteobacteria bacterium]